MYALPQERQGHEGGLRELVLARAHAALGAIEAARRRVDDLNVYPVPDGDTGTNLTLSVRAIVEALEASPADDRASLAREAARAALIGARGNSGVILSQIVRGAAESFAESDDVARALRRASDTAYAQVGKPVEGTMLTVIRELAEEAERDGDIDAILAHGDACVARTTEMLPVLREAGVVDAGAAGLVELVRGLAGRAGASAVPAAAAADAAGHELSRYRFCTSFVVEGAGLDAAALERELEALGDSVLVVGDATALRAHVHTDEPERAVALGRARGVVDGLEVADMHEQIVARTYRLEHPVVVVADGEGNRRLLESLGARVVDRPPTDADGAIVLDYPVPALLSALVAYSTDRTVGENEAAMRAAAASVACAAVEEADEAALRAAAAKLLSEPRTLLTVLTGAGAPPLERFVAWLHEAYPDVEVEVHEGGQRGPAFLLGAE